VHGRRGPRTQGRKTNSPRECRQYSSALVENCFRTGRPVARDLASLIDCSHTASYFPLILEPQLELLEADFLNFLVVRQKRFSVSCSSLWETGSVHS